MLRRLRPTQISARIKTKFVRGMLTLFVNENEPSVDADGDAAEVVETLTHEDLGTQDLLLRADVLPSEAHPYAEKPIHTFREDVAGEEEPVEAAPQLDRFLVLPPRVGVGVVPPLQNPGQGPIHEVRPHHNADEPAQRVGAEAGAPQRPHLRDRNASREGNQN